MGSDLPGVLPITAVNETDGDASPGFEKMNGLDGRVAGGAWMALWFLRSRHDETKRTDLYCFAVALMWRNRDKLREWMPNSFEVIPVQSSLLVFAMGITLWSVSAMLNAPSSTSIGEVPWILPSRTSHTRMFPQKHSFAYSLLQVAIPVGSSGRFGSFISVGEVDRKAWYHVQASDYLERNSPETDLKSKLRHYLHSQGIDDSAWDHAYLITAPRFLGYAFNPVSFWYIYTAQDVLTMMILEVNNTFDERRMYLLHAKDPEERSEDSHSSNPPTPGDEAPTIVPPAVPNDGKFRKAWTKDFHVSPFNSRKGYYMLTAIDPFGGKAKDDAPFFSNTITLKSSKDHVKLVARVFSDGRPLNPTTSSWAEMIHFIVSWFWIGFLTFPRILKEAAKLFWSRGLHVWFRPEVLASSIGRREAKIETDLAVFFESYLEHLILQHPTPIRILYTSNLQGSLPRTLINRTGESDTELENIDTLELRVLSPVFFARFVHYARSIDAFDHECVFTDEKNRTVWLSRPDLMRDLLNAQQTDVPSTRRTVPLQKLRWIIHRILRCLPPTPAYPSAGSARSLTDLRASVLSELDLYVRQRMAKRANEYRLLCGRLFLAQRLAFGFVEIVDWLDFIIRTLLTWQAAAVVASRGMDFTWKSMIMLGGVHLWAWIKGR